MGSVKARPLHHGKPCTFVNHIPNHMLLALLCLLAVGAAPKWRLYGLLQYSQEPGV